MIRSASQTGAKPILRTNQEGLHTKLDGYTPEDVQECHTSADLDALLRFYGRTPFIKQIGLADSTFARRWYMERTRPALRWYCKHFHTPVPWWLKDENLPDWSAEEKKHLFGADPLEVIEFERRVAPEPHEMQPAAKPPKKG